MSVVLLGSILTTTAQEKPNADPAKYKVKRLKQSIQIDANWNKPAWRRVKPLHINNLMGSTPSFIPTAQAKMMYDEENLYVIYKVDDRFIKIVTDKINGPVWRDSAVEFFFSPDSAEPLKYFNLEVNGGGTPLLAYSASRDKRINEQDIRLIEIAQTLPKIVDPEIKEPTEWTLEFRIPIEMLKKHGGVTQPAKGVEWRANFYKIAENTSNIHFLTWSVIVNDKPNFHLPKFFGILKFQ